MTWRLQAQRLLVERRAIESVDDLLALVRDPSQDVIGLNVGAIHALHTLEGLGVIASQAAALNAVCSALGHASAGVRRNALSVLPADARGAKAIHENNALFSDADAQVRLQTFLRLADFPATEFAGNVIAQAAHEVHDSYLFDALMAAAVTHATHYLNALVSLHPGKSLTANGIVVEGPKVTSSSVNIQIAGRVAEHFSRGRPTIDELLPIVAIAGSVDRELQNVILEGLTAGLPSTLELQTTTSFDAALMEAFRKVDVRAKSKLIRLAARSGSKALDAFTKEIVDSMLVVIGDINADYKNRAAAAFELISFRSDDVDAVSRIVEQLGANTAPELGGRFLRAIHLSRSTKAGDVLLEAVPSLTPRLKSAAISTLLMRPDWAKSLLSGLQLRTIELTDLSLDQKQSLRTFPDAGIREQAEKLLSMSGGLPDANRDKVLKSLLRLTKQDGNVDAGRDMFKKHCAACHRHGELGKTIGPNLTGMAVHPKAELLTHIIDPSRSVEGNFRIYTVVTTEGQVFNGMLASETRTSITLIDAKAKETSIQRQDIDELIASKKSLMPEGFEKQMTDEELSDLLGFLANKGKYVPLPLDRYATAVSTKGLFHEGDNGPDRMIFSDWSPKVFKGNPFVLTDPRGKSRPNIVLLHGPNGSLPPTMPKSVSLSCNTAAKTIHLLSGVGGWSFPFDRKKTVSMIVRLHYDDGESEDHELINGVHFADYIRRVDVPESEFAYQLGGQQIRYLSVSPLRSTKISTIELLKGTDNSSPIVMALTVETP